MIRMKSCPKCRGTVRIDRDQYGWYEQCIQCGFVRDLETVELSGVGSHDTSTWQDEDQVLKPIKPFGSHEEYTDKGLY